MIKGRSNWIKLIVIVAVIAVIAWFFWPKGGENAEQAMQGMPPAEVTVQKVTAKKVDFSSSFPGRVVAFRTAEIRPQVSGVIVKRLFEEGSLVQQGQQLYQIDIAPYNAAYNSAKASLQRAEANVRSVKAKTERYTNLVKINAVSKQEFDDATASLAQAQADVAVAKAALETADINVKYTRVYSPITGRIGKSKVTEGALVNANQAEAIAVVQQLDKVYVDLEQSSSEMMRLRNQFSKDNMPEKMPVTLSIENSKDVYSEKGELQFSDVTVDPTTGAIELRAIFPNPDNILLPGLFVRAHLVQASDPQAIMIPQRALVRSAAGVTNVWVVSNDNKVSLKPIKVEQAVGKEWRVTEGLSVGETIVIEGLQKIQPDAVVKPVMEGTKAEAATDAPAAKPEESKK